MMPPKPLYSYIAAGALAVVTIFTFYVFRDFGPQSVIRRFHIDVARQDWNDINTLVVQPTTAPSTKYMIWVVTQLIHGNASFEIIEIKRQHHEVLAVVEYRYPIDGTQAIVWHLRQSQTEWRIDCDATVGGWPQANNRAAPK